MARMICVALDSLVLREEILRKTRFSLTFMIIGQMFINPNKVYFWWNDELLSKLESNIQRKWKKHLPVVDILFEKIKAKDIQFNPLDF